MIPKNILESIYELQELYQKYIDCINAQNINNGIKKLSDFSDESEKCLELRNDARKHLESLTKETVNKIFTVMDYGRHSEFDEEISLEDAYKKFEDWDKDLAIDKLLEKTNIIDLLNKGLKYFSSNQ